VQRQTQVFNITDFSTTKLQLLYWANQYSSCSFLDNNQYKLSYHTIECLVGVGSLKIFKAAKDCQKELKCFLKETNDWLFGHVGYEYGEIIDGGKPDINSNSHTFEVIHFFQPEIVVLLHKDSVEIQSMNKTPKEVFESITKIKIPTQNNSTAHSVIRATQSKEDYLNTIYQLKQHIKRGDCYEINYCQEFYIERANINPLAVYLQLTTISPNPFSCYYKVNNNHLLCASPERYLLKKENKLISQPIKGTAKRNLLENDVDNVLKRALHSSAKERAENVMIVDLVRNDLSRICKEATVKVEELFGIHTFPHIHQMISTVTGEIDPEVDFADVLQASFPMGSMTGAPKKRVMELIKQYEPSARGLYSGTVGYIAPNKDFDFNVVIRSVVYNTATQYLSYHVGSGITYYSDADAEYEECLLKAQAIKAVLG